MYNLNSNNIYLEKIYPVHCLFIEVKQEKGQASVYDHLRDNNSTLKKENK